MPVAKKRKLAKGDDDESVENTDVTMKDVGVERGSPENNSQRDESMEEGSDEELDSNESPDTEEEIEHAQRRKKSKKTAKRKIRATEPEHFGSTLEALLSTAVPSTSKAGEDEAVAPLALKPSINRRNKRERKELIARRNAGAERKEHEEVGRITDIIGGWGGENERALRKVAQRGVVQLFNVIQKSQAAQKSEENDKLALRGSGKPTLQAPKMHSKHKKAKDVIPKKNESVDKDDFMNAIRSGGIVSKV